MTTLTTNNRKFDLIGIGLSFICGIHCIVTPFLILSAPIIGKSLESAWVHSSLIAFMVIAFHQSIYKQYKKHGSKLTLGLGCIGLAFILITYFNEIFGHHEEGHGHVEGHHDEGMMIYIAVLGAIMLITSHILNIQKCKCIQEMTNE